MTRVFALTHLCSAALLAQINFAEHQQRGIFDLYCQPIIEDGRIRILAMTNRAQNDTYSEFKNCGKNDACKARVKARAQQRSAEILAAEAAITRQVAQCANSLIPAAQPAAVPARTCQGVIDYSRQRIGSMQEKAKENYRSGGKRCGRDLKCHSQAKTSAAREARTIQVEQASLTRQIRDCEDGTDWDTPRTASGDWDPVAPIPGTRNMKTRDGDWLPDPCQGFVEFATYRMHRLQNQVDEAYKVDRINCAGDLGCLAQARETSAQRAEALKAEQARLGSEIRQCQVRNPPPA